MKTLVVTIGKRSESEFRRVVNELKGLQFHFDAVSLTWSREVEDERAEYYVKQFRNAGIKAEIRG
jgi:hypothetical protein